MTFLGYMTKQMQHNGSTPRLCLTVTTCQFFMHFHIVPYHRKNRARDIPLWDVYILQLSNIFSFGVPQLCPYTNGGEIWHGGPSPSQ